MKAVGAALESGKLAGLPKPLIALMNSNHLVVVERFADEGVYVNDPAQGHIRLSREEFDDGYSGVVLVFAKGPDFCPIGKPGSIIATLAQRLKGSRRAFLFVVLASLGLIVPGWLLPTFTRQFVDQYFVDRQEYWLLPLLIGMTLTVSLQGAFTYLQQLSLSRLQTKFAMTWGSAFFWHLLRLPLGFFSERHVGDLSNRFKYADRIAQLVAEHLTLGLMNLLSVVLYGLIMLQYDVGLAGISFAAVILGWGILSRAAKDAGTAGEKWYIERGAFFGAALNMLTQKEQFKANGTEAALFANLAGRHGAVLAANQRVEWRRVLLRAGTNTFNAAHGVLVLAYGSRLIMTGEFTVGMLIAYQILAISFVTPVIAIIGLGMRLAEARAMLGAIDEVMDHEPADEFDQGGDGAPQASGTVWAGRIEIKDVSFGYNPFDPPVIDRVSLDIEPGARVALVGASGSGRSTLGHLIAGLRRPTAGEILYDGRPMKSIQREEFRSHVAMLEQSAMLFDTSIRNNLTLWNDALPEEQMVRGAKAACIHDSIVERKGGYDHEITANGANFSSGECQQLEIARIIAQQPSVLVMDESTSYLDSLTEAQITENIRRLGITCIFIAHRLNTVRDCDLIVVLDKGRVVEKGTHESLMALKGHYWRLVETW